ncbi:MAG: choice-of-anchor J domain-containing protein, partial [Candidatus Eisenbacteria bacterium]
MALRSRPFVALSAALWLMAGSAAAFVPTPDHDTYEIFLAGERTAMEWRTVSLAEAKAFSGAPDFAARYGGSWRVQWNDATATAHQLFGSGTSVTSAPVTTAGEAERIARRFLGANPGLFGTVDAGLETRTSTRAAGKWSIVFGQTREGIPVRGGRAHVVMTEEGRLFGAGSDLHSDISVSTVPSITGEEATAIAASDLGFNDATDAAQGAALEILPVVEGAAATYRLVYNVQLRMENPLGLWETLVDASSGEIVRRVNLIRFFDVNGNVDADLYDPHYCGNPLVLREMPNHYVTLSGVGTATTGDDGNFTATGASGTVSWSALLQGIWANVQNYSGAEAYESGSVTEGQFLQVHWDNTNSRADERTCYYHQSVVHDYIRDVDSGPGLADIDYQMLVTVARTDGYCPGNAWYDYSGINFCVGNASYGNTGEMADVIYHEFGHGITHRIYNVTGNPPGDLHEGNSDVIANLLTGESIIGLGFYLNNCTSGIRNSDNNLQYPADWTGQNHYSGQIIAGVVWDAWQELKISLGDAAALDQIGNVWHYGRSLMLPETQPDQVLSMLIADDDDGNLVNGTPHYAEICQGAANHGFDCAGLIGTSPEIAYSPVSFDETLSAGSQTTAGLYIENIGTGVLTYSLAGVQTTLAKATAATDAARGAGSREMSTDNSRTLEFLRRSASAGKTAAVIFSDDMEGGVNGWTTTVHDGTSSDLWHQVTTNANSPTHSWWCGLDGSGTYDTGARISNALVSPSIDLSSGTPPLTLEFYENYTTESGWDFCNVDISTNGGGTWTNLRTASGSSGGWTLSSVDLSAYAGGTVNIRFHFDTTDGLYNSYPGWFVDDVSVNATGVSWLVFAPMNGAVPAGETDTVEVTFDAGALAPGDYEANIRITSNDQSNPTEIVPVALHVGGGIDPFYSTIAVNDDLMLSPDGGGDSTMTIVVTVKDGNDDPIVGVPAGDVAVTLSGTSYIGASVRFCQ